jgi:hypothetical protein
VQKDKKKILTKNFVLKNIKVQKKLKNKLKKIKNSKKRINFCLYSSRLAFFVDILSNIVQMTSQNGAIIH